VMVKLIVLKPSHKDSESTLCISFSQQSRDDSRKLDILSSGLKKFTINSTSF